MLIKSFIFTTQQSRQFLLLLVAIATSLNISACACKEKDQANVSVDNEETSSQKEVNNPLTLALTSSNGSQLTGDTPLSFLIKNTGKHTIIPDNLKLRVLRGGTAKSCIEHDLPLSKQIPVGGQITETIPIIPGMSKQITFICQIIHRVGAQEKIVGDPLTVEWKSSEPVLTYHITYDKNTGEVLCTIAKEGTEPLQGIELHCKSKTSGVSFNGQSSNKEQTIAIGDFQADNKPVVKKLGRFDLGNNQCATFDFWLSHAGGPHEYAKQTIVLTAADVRLEIIETSYDVEKNRVIYRLHNSGQDVAQDIKLHYINISRDEVGSAVLINNKKEGTINLGNIDEGSFLDGELAIALQSANKFKIGLEITFKDAVLDSLCTEVLLPKLQLIPTTPDFLLGANKTIQFKIGEENNLPIDLSKLNILVNSANEAVKIFYQDNEIMRELVGTKLGCLDNPVRLTIETGKTSTTSITIQLKYCGKNVAEKTFTWQDDVSEATKKLFEAVEQRDLTKISELLNEGEVQVNATDKEGEGLLWKATLNSDQETVLALLHVQGIDVNARNNDSSSNLFGYNLLQWYVQQGDMDMVAELLHKGAKINEAMDDQIGYTPLHLSISNGNVNMLDLLLQNSLINLHTPDKSGATPLHLAICAGNQEAIDKLLLKGADVNAVDNFGRTPLHMLVTYQGSQDNVSKLLQQGADPMAIDNFGRTPLDIAMQKGYISTIKQLVSMPVQSTTKGQGNVNGSCLHDIVVQGRIAIIERLVQLVGVNIQDGCGNTLLHYAVKQGDETIARLLLEKGADLELKNNQQQSPQDWFELYCPCKE